MPAKKTKKVKKDLKQDQKQDQKLNEIINYWKIIIMINFYFIFNVFNTNLIFIQISYKFKLYDEF